VRKETRNVSAIQIRNVNAQSLRPQNFEQIGRRRVR
jgi:hypothetical protein